APGPCPARADTDRHWRWVARTHPHRARNHSPVRSADAIRTRAATAPVDAWPLMPARSEEHTSELQSRENLVCRLLREKKKMSEKIDVKALREKVLATDDIQHDETYIEEWTVTLPIRTMSSANLKKMSKYTPDPIRIPS